MEQANKHSPKRDKALFNTPKQAFREINLLDFFNSFTKLDLQSGQQLLQMRSVIVLLVR